MEDAAKLVGRPSRLRRRRLRIEGRKRKFATTATLVRPLESHPRVLRAYPVGRPPFLETAIAVCFT